MSRAADRCRRAWRRMVRAYHMACARDDAARHGVVAPSGVWVCLHCQLPLLALPALHEHIRVEHAF